MTQSHITHIAYLINELTPIADIADYLDQLSAQDRLQASRSLNASLQKKLWTLCESRVVSRYDIVPQGREMQIVRHLGRNTLPVFKYFEKRFYAPSIDSDIVWGYNEGPTRPLVGPGYFTARDCRDDEPEAFVIDYELIPQDFQLADWPKVQVNERGLSRFVYAYMQDYMRKVSQHVTIGRAYRKGKESPNYFTLCRWDEAQPPQL